MKLLIFVFIVVVVACACFVVAWDGVCQFICVACPASVACMTRGAIVTVAVFFIDFLEFFIACFVVDLLRDIQGMNFLNLPEVSRLEDLLVHGCICCACIAAIGTSVTMIVIVV